MPFVVHPVGVTPTAADLDLTPRTFPAFANQADAAAARPTHHKVSYVETDGERLDWTRRESQRLKNGTYRGVPWPYWDGCYEPSLHNPSASLTLTRTFVMRYGPPATWYHYAHRAHGAPGQIAYTPDAAFGVQDRQVTTTPGRYLEKFWPSAAADAAMRRAWIDACTAGTDLHLACTADEIERVYRGSAYASVPFRSCMGPDKHVRMRDPHPVRAYGDSDLAVAYLGPIDAVLARGVVWPDRKLYSRLYGDGALEYTLKDAGYTHGTHEGARLRAIAHPHEHGYVMPYLDGVEYGTRKGEWIVLGSGPINVQVTCGWSGVSCGHCGASHTGDGAYCAACVERDCAACGSGFRGAGTYSVRAGGTVCDTCAEIESTCEVCGETWAEVGLPRDRQTARLAPHHAGRVCERCAPDTRVCHACDLPQLADGSPCEDCGVVERCAFTRALPFDDGADAVPALASYGAWMFAPSLTEELEEAF